jgi:hypothetical protein
MTDNLVTVGALLGIWDREDWDDDVWVAELRSTADPLRRAGYGEEWWLGFDADPWWQEHCLHMQDVTSHGWGDRRLRDLSLTLAGRYGEDVPAPVDFR